MKLLVDENLPPQLVHDLADLFPDSTHVRDVGLRSTPDESIWKYARDHGFAFITKDNDFANLSRAKGAPPKVIILQTGNCSSAVLISLIRRNAIRFSELENNPEQRLLILK